ncbi:hypothetical protein [Actinopolymorpha rutila]|uniref:Polyketide cyclase / dehydrase and lipid transport n=1 Tax=Actinopolymorpha rutila TaxID=446787 RepID=A0A852ZN18_9ACTN|nr:hypothetical protein [Actinopolymorpha rutila]NYH93288.1 hypothetical protein [Actinopolymorpha rutila]
MTDTIWPEADLDPVRRLRVMAAVIPGAVYAEDVLPLSFDEVWAVAADLENEFPRLLTDVRTMRITRADGERLEALARGRFGQRARFDVVLRPGWCWMQSRFLLGGMAAAAEADRTRFAFMGTLRVPGARLLHPLSHALGASPGSRVIHRMARRASARAQEPQ